MKRRLGLAGALVAVTLAACDDGINKGWLVDRTRVLGVRVEPAGDPNRAAIAPSEPVRATWLVVDPNGGRRFAYAFAACEGPGGNYPETRCSGPVLTSGSGVHEGSERVAIDFNAPPREALRASEELLFLAAFCQVGEPTLDPRAFTATCSGGSAPLLASVQMPLVSAAPNANPTIADDAIRFDGKVLPPSTLLARAPCEGSAEAPVAKAGEGEKDLIFRFRGDERETGESLILTHVVTAGELDRQYSTLEADEAAPKDVAVSWKAPAAANVPPSGMIVELHFILRDGRGGTAFARRSLCVRP